MDAPILYIFAGANGSGKTTVAKLFCKTHGIAFINADEIAKMLAGPEGNVDDFKVPAGREFLRQLKEKNPLRKTFAIESTLSGLTLKKHILKAKQIGYKIHLLYLFLDSENMNVVRVHTRVLQGGHNIPEIDIRRRYRTSRQRFWAVYRPLCDFWQLYFNADSPDLIAMGDRDQCRIMDTDRFNQFRSEINDES
ncbi:MAG: zeta toxin family protein [Candidatus Margulisiibacteriota bacterium]